MEIPEPPEFASSRKSRFLPALDAGSTWVGVMAIAIDFAAGIA
jgi:hypothetical protein